MIVLWQFEECENSRPVRLRMTELGVDFIAIDASAGHPEKDAVMERLFGTARTPALWDTQSGALIHGQEECLEYVSRVFERSHAETTA